MFSFLLFPDSNFKPRFSPPSENKSERGGSALFSFTVLVGRFVEVEGYFLPNVAALLLAMAKIP